MLKLKVFDPAMCCSTGICGNSVDPKLVTFAADLEWLKKQGIDVVRHGLSFEPAEFVSNEAIKNLLNKEGNDCLPALLIDKEIVSKGCYPSRKKLAEICGIEWKAEYEKQEATPIEIETCGPDCDCHNSALSGSAKKILFIIVLLIMGGIVAFKMSSKVNAAEPGQITPVKNQTTVANFGQPIDSLDKIKQGNIAFVFIPSKDNKNITTASRNTAISAQKTLAGKNITVDFYTLKTTFSDYSSIASSAKTPTILVLKGQNKSIVSGIITQSKLLQAYMTVIQPGCGAGCPCHRK